MTPHHTLQHIKESYLNHLSHLNGKMCKIKFLNDSIFFVIKVCMQFFCTECKVDQLRLMEFLTSRVRTSLQNLSGTDFKTLRSPIARKTLQYCLENSVRNSIRSVGPLRNLLYSLIMIMLFTEQLSLTLMFHTSSVPQTVSVNPYTVKACQVHKYRVCLLYTSRCV